MWCFQVILFGLSPLYVDVASVANFAPSDDNLEAVDDGNNASSHRKCNQMFCASAPAV